MICKMNFIPRRACVALLMAISWAWVDPAIGASSDSALPASTMASTATTQAETLLAGIRSGSLMALPDDALIAAFTQIHPQTLPTYLQLGVKPFNEYEMWMRREERLAEEWPRQPFLNQIKYRHQPRQIYMKWLKDSPKSGQEIIYDETRRKDAMLGHMGGIFNVTSIWTALDSPTARSNSRHSIRDLGMQFMVDTIVQENRLRTAEGVSTAPTRVEVATFQGERCIALTWTTPPGFANSYAHRVKVHLDLHQPLIRQIEAWDASGEMIERIAIEKIVPAQFDDSTFNPKNPAYAF